MNTLRRAIVALANLQRYCDGDVRFDVKGTLTAITYRPRGEATHWMRFAYTGGTKPLASLARALELAEDTASVRAVRNVIKSLGPLPTHLRKKDPSP